MKTSACGRYTSVTFTFRRVCVLPRVLQNKSTLFPSGSFFFFCLKKTPRIIKLGHYDNVTILIWHSGKYEVILPLIFVTLLIVKTQPSPPGGSRHR